MAVGRSWTGFAVGAVLGFTAAGAAWSQAGDYFGTTTREAEPAGARDDVDVEDGGYMPGEPAIDRFGRDSECGGTNRAYYDKMYGTEATVLDTEEANRLYRKGDVIRCGVCPPDREICWLKHGTGATDYVAQLPDERYRNSGTGGGGFGQWRYQQGEQSNAYARYRAQQEYNRRNAREQQTLIETLSGISGVNVPRFEQGKSNVGGGGFGTNYIRVPAGAFSKPKTVAKTPTKGGGLTTNKTGKGARKAPTIIR